MPLYITEYASMAQFPGAQMPQDPPLAEQVIAIGGLSAQSSPLNPNTRLIRLHADSICSIAVGVNPIASSVTGRLAANQTEYRGVAQGGSFKVAAITNS